MVSDPCTLGRFIAFSACVRESTNSDGFGGRYDHIADHRFDASFHRPIHAFIHCLRARAHLRTILQHAAPSGGDVFWILTLFRVEHDATWFSADMGDALHESLVLCDVDHRFGIGSVIMPWSATITMTVPLGTLRRRRPSCPSTRSYVPIHLSESQP